MKRFKYLSYEHLKNPEYLECVFSLLLFQSVKRAVGFFFRFCDQAV